MHRRAPDEKALAEVGMTLADFDDDGVEVWPDNQRALAIFRKFNTQWIVGMGGATGLNYMPVLHHLDRLKLEVGDYDELFADLQVMEAAALDEIHRKG